MFSVRASGSSLPDHDLPFHRAGLGEFRAQRLRVQIRHTPRLKHKHSCGLPACAFVWLPGPCGLCGAGWTSSATVPKAMGLSLRGLSGSAPAHSSYHFTCPSLFPSKSSLACTSPPAKLSLRLGARALTTAAHRSSPHCALWAPGTVPGQALHWAGRHSLGKWWWLNASEGPVKEHRRWLDASLVY